MAQALLPQDVIVLAKLVAYGGKRPALAEMASALNLSSSQIHLSLRRLSHARLISGDDCRPNLRAVEEFLVHGVKYSFPARRGEITRGLPTAHAAPPLNEHISGSADLPPVWPLAEGQVRGSAFEPLHRSAPVAAANDQRVYELLALIDALRDGRARERQLAERELGLLLRRLLRD